MEDKIKISATKSAVSPSLGHAAATSTPMTTFTASASSPLRFQQGGRLSGANNHNLHNDIFSTDIKKYLRRCGYLTIGSERLGYQGKYESLLPNTSENGVSDRATIEAISNFKNFYKLPNTLEADESFSNLIKQPRCGMPDIGPNRRNFLNGSFALGEFKTVGASWNVSTLTYRFLNNETDIPDQDMHNAIRNAFNTWESVCNIRFVEVANNEQVPILFGRYEHGDRYPFDGPGSVLAHAFYPPPVGGNFAGDLHFDADETWVIADVNGTDLETVALHEIGHILGLDHSDIRDSIMYAYYGGPSRALKLDDIDGVQSLYGPPIKAQFGVPGWFGHESQGGGVAAWDFDNNGSIGFVVFHIDNPKGGNGGYYRIGKNLNADLIPTSWTDIKQVPGWFGDENSDGAITLVDLDNSGHPDLIVLHVDNPSKDNSIFYRVGYNMDGNGNVSSWSSIKQVPGWVGYETQGAGVATFRSSNRTLNLVVYHIDNPSKDNSGWYRVGRGLDVYGNVASWTDPIRIPGWFGYENQGGGIAITDISGNGHHDLVVFHADNPGGENRGYYRVGKNLHDDGKVDSWGGIKPLAGWWGHETAGADICAFSLGGKNYLAAMHIDNPSGDNHAYIRIASI